MNISISIPQSANNYWRQMGQSGLRISAAVNCSVRCVLEESLGFTNDYIEERIETVFLDGHPVDDIDTATVPSGARMALASALPGAAGVAMRRNSPYAALRGGITHTATSTGQKMQGMVEVVLFNLIMQHHTMRLLANGVSVKSGMLADMIDKASADEVGTIQADGKIQSAAEAVTLLRKKEGEFITLTVTCIQA
ncbi:hypothetical protein [Oleidesulfovibrio sp.]|uniref:hypothetical protein n=1 Tax=Oleidesulfovibrio sp. TaxID=2909707 RepID=UPI003A85ACC1